MKTDISVIENWLADDPDADTRTELSALLAAAVGGDTAAAAEIDDRFSGSLEFGTAGLRGAMGAGPNRMNRAVVIRAAAGLAAWLTERFGSDYTVVIGCDARHGSAQFATDTAAVITAAGGQALVLPAAQPTPVLAFAVRHLNAEAGVMVTASHNPAADNGYKVYLGGKAAADTGRGVQIVPPYDSQIAAKIAAVASVASVPRAASGWGELDDSVRQEYVNRVVSLVPFGRASHLKIVTTAMHGVGGATLLEALQRAGFDDVHPVPEQMQPDPDFPTVSFPNPEEPGALDLAIGLARRLDADLILANDPDADRLAVAVPVPGGYRQLTGDQVGWLLGDQAAAVAAVSGAGVLACSLVSSRMLEKIAATHGLRHQYTLTGFKWISRVPGLVFGYEEALGYCTDPEYVRDKDGISAAVRLALLASQLADQDDTLTDLLDRLELQHGVHATAPLTLRVSNLDRIPQAMAALRATPLTHLADSRVVEFVDLTEGWRGLPPTEGLYFRSKAGDRVVIRPSGTEPKLKCYLESVVELPKGAVLGDLSGAREQATARVERIKADLAAFLEQD